mgnify:CR=1 FL=1
MSDPDILTNKRLVEILSAQPSDLPIRVAIRGVGGRELQPPYAATIIRGFTELEILLVC